MTLVEFYIVVPTGGPLANTLVEIQLSRSTFTKDVNGIAMPRPVSVTTDAQGKAVLPLWPSTTAYFAQVRDPNSEAELFYKFIVPNVPAGTVVRLQDLVIDAPISKTYYDEAALAAIHDAKVNSRASEIAAAASATATAALVRDMSDTIQAAIDAKDAAVLAAFNAQVKAAEALASKQSAATDAAAASTAAASVQGNVTVINGKLDQANTALTAALGAQAAAEANATTATQKAVEATSAATAAAGSVTVAQAAQAAAAASATDALDSKTQSNTFATNAAASAAAAAASAEQAGQIAGGDFVTKFNGRKGIVTLTALDVETALGFAPATAGGNVASATKLATARTINGVAFDGTANITVADATKLPLSGGTLTGALTATGLSVGANAVWHAGNLSNLNQLTNGPGFVTAAANVASATKLATTRNINGVAFDGTANITVADATKLPLSGGTLTGALTATEISVGSNPVWHAGNLTPSAFPPAATPISVNTNAAVNTLYHLDSAAASFEVVLPAEPANNSWIWIVDAKGSCGSKPVTINFNGKAFGEVMDNVLMDLSNDSLFMFFNNNRWVEQ